MLNDRLETLILNNLITNESYARKVFPYLKDYYFEDKVEKEIFTTIQEFFLKYNDCPTPGAVLIEVEGKSLKQEIYDKAVAYINEFTDDEIDDDWLTDKTEEFCKGKEVDHALGQIIEIREGAKGKTKNKINQILPIMQKALSVGFDISIGHNYFQDAKERFEYYNKQEHKIPFGFEYLDKITNGGVAKETLNIIMASTGVGKTMVMCNLAASHLMCGYNVLYITLEESEFEISKRIDANLLDVELDKLKHIPAMEFEDTLSRLRRKTEGELEIKKYPAQTASILHFKNHINELKIKKGFVPQILYIDYLNNMVSSVTSPGERVTNSYAYIKNLAVEARQIGDELHLPVISATQTNREGKKAKEVELEHTAESYGVPQDADFILALKPTEDVSKIQLKQLKNRYGDSMKDIKFLMGIDRAKQKLYDIDNDAVVLEDDEVSGFENTPFGQRMKNGNGMHSSVTKGSLSKTMKKFKGRGGAVDQDEMI